jgi:hypothetical protein
MEAAFRRALAVVKRAGLGDERPAFTSRSSIPITTSAILSLGERGFGPLAESNLPQPMLVRLL